MLNCMWTRIKLGTASHCSSMMKPYHSSYHACSRSLLFRLLCFRAAKFWLRILLLWFLQLADSTGTSNGFLTKICSVPLLRCVIDNTFVNSASWSAYLIPEFRHLKIVTDLGPDFCPLQVTSFLLATGRLRCFVFFVVKVTPPFSAG